MTRFENARAKETLTLIVLIFVAHIESRVRIRFWIYLQTKMNQMKINTEFWKICQIEFLASISKYFHQLHRVRQSKIYRCKFDHWTKSITFHNVCRFENFPGNMLQHNHTEHNDNEWQNVSGIHSSNSWYVRIYAKSIQRFNDEYGARRTLQIGWMATKMSNQASEIDCIFTQFFVFWFFVFQGMYIARNFTLNSERFPTYTPEMRYNVTIQYLFAPDKRKPNERIEMVKIYVLGKMDSTNDVKRRRQALGRGTRKSNQN